MDKRDKGLYQSGHIIGHTGDIDKSPTVYYGRRKQSGSIEYGHITQSHYIPENVGREPAVSSRSYIFGNVQGKFVEHDPEHGMSHQSRSAFTPVTPETHDTLAEAHQTFRRTKALPPLGSQQREDLIEMRSRQADELSDSGTLNRVAKAIHKPTDQAEAFAMRLLARYKITK